MEDSILNNEAVAALLFVVGVFLVVIFVQIAINVARICRMMEHDPGTTAPRSSSADPANPS
jgi:hypothetical protein